MAVWGLGCVRRRLQRTLTLAQADWVRSRHSFRPTLMTRPASARSSGPSSRVRLRYRLWSPDIAAGAKRVIGIDRVPARLAIAEKECGAEVVNFDEHSCVLGQR